MLGILVQPQGVNYVLSLLLEIAIFMFFTNVNAPTSFVHASASEGKHEVLVWPVCAYADLSYSLGTNHNSDFYSILEFIPITRKNHPT